MSKLTYNLLHAIDYEQVKRKRTDNYNTLHEILYEINQLDVNKVEGVFMYPLLIYNAEIIRKKCIEKKIYIPILWPNVLEEVPEDWLDWKYARNILPLPCDQRYSIEEMEYIGKVVLECMH